MNIALFWSAVFIILGAVLATLGVIVLVHRRVAINVMGLQLTYGAGRAVVFGFSLISGSMFMVLSGIRAQYELFCVGATLLLLLNPSFGLLAFIKQYRRKP